MFMNLGLGRLSPAAEAHMTTPNYYVARPPARMPHVHGYLTATSSMDVFLLPTILYITTTCQVVTELNFRLGN
jgi:hypothetical protein